MKHCHTKIEIGQMWKRKKNPIEIIVTSGHGDDWLVERIGNTKIQHHMTKFNLYKYWDLNNEDTLLPQ